MSDDPYPGARNDAGLEPGLGRSTGTPGWVKVFGAIALVVILMFAFVLITGVGNHGPARHLPPPEGVEHGDRRP